MKTKVILSLILLGCINHVMLHSSELSTKEQLAYLATSFVGMALYEAALEQVNLKLLLPKDLGDDKAAEIIDSVIVLLNGNLLAGIIFDDRAKMKKIYAGTIAAVTAFHLAYLIHKKRQVDAPKMKKPLRSVSDDDICGACLISFKELQAASKEVMQTQCCGQIMCKEDMLNYIQAWNKRPDATSQQPRCFICSDVSLEMQSVDMQLYRDRAASL